MSFLSWDGRVRKKLYILQTSDHEMRLLSMRHSYWQPLTVKEFKGERNLNKHLQKKFISSCRSGCNSVKGNKVLPIKPKKIREDNINIFLG